MTTDPIVKTIEVPLGPDAAFELFTAKIGTWWPVESHSVSAGNGAPSQSLTLDARMGGALVEIASDGTQHVWGEVLEWEPGQSLRVTWHPGKMTDQQTEVRVTFEAAGDGCRVELTHSGWEALEEGAKMRSGYNDGSVGVLERYSKAA